MSTTQGAEPRRSSSDDAPVLDYRAVTPPVRKRWKLRILSIAFGAFGGLLLLMALGLLALSAIVNVPGDRNGFYLGMIVYCLIGGVCIAFSVRWGRVAFARQTSSPHGGS